MARARVTLRDALSYTKGGKTFKRSEPKIVDKDSEIAYFKATSGFAVTMLSEQPLKQKAVEPPSGAPESDPDGDPESGLDEDPGSDEAPETQPAPKTAKRGLRRRGKKR